ncbi:MAG: hypothetical protein ACLSAH_08360 [Bilophila wadsworthia]
MERTRRAAKGLGSSPGRKLICLLGSCTGAAAKGLVYRMRRRPNRCSYQLLDVVPSTDRHRSLI